MSGQLCRKKYDDCALMQEFNLSTTPLDAIMDENRFVNRSGGNGIPEGTLNPSRGLSLVEMDTMMRGLDQKETRCVGDQYPYCANGSCMLTSDQRIPQIPNPRVRERELGSNREFNPNLFAQQPPRQEISTGPIMSWGANGEIKPAAQNDFVGIPEYSRSQQNAIVGINEFNRGPDGVHTGTSRCIKGINIS